MRNIRRILSLLILTFLMLSVCGIGLAQECRRGIREFPCIIDWTSRLADPGFSSAVSQPSIGVTRDNELLVPGVMSRINANDDSAEVVRMLYKFKSDGTEILNSSGGHWFSAAALDVDSIPWQRIAVDNERGRVFVLFATMPARSNGSAWSFWLRAHDLQTGEKLAGWGLDAGMLGESSTLNAGLAIDSAGNPWTVLEARSGVDPVCLQVRKWDGNNGNKLIDQWLTSTQPGTSTRFVGFGIRKSDNKMYLAFSDAGETGITQDLVVTLLDSSFHLLDTKEIEEELQRPTVISYPADGNYMSHPLFTDGLVGDDGDFSVGGMYLFSPPWNSPVEGDSDYGFPTLMRFGITASGDKLDLKFDYREVTHYVGDRVKIQLANGPNGSIWIGPSRPNMYPAAIYVIGKTGQLQSFTYLPLPDTFHVVEDPRGSGYYYTVEDYVLSFTSNQGQPVLAGIKNKRYFHGGSPTGDSSWSGFVAGYYDGMRLACCALMPLMPFQRYPSLPLPRYLGMALQNRLVGTTASGPASERNRAGGALLMKAWPNASRKDLQFNLMPTLLHASILIEDSRPPEFFGGLVERLIGDFERAPLGFAFDKSVQTSTVNALRQVQSSGQLTLAFRSKLVEATNALALDQQVEVLSAKKTMLATGGRPAVGRIAWMTGTKSAQPGTLSINVRNGLPALVKGFEPAWPLATYHFEFTGEVSDKDPIVVRFSVSDFGFEREVQSYHLLQWDGSSYRDITDSFDAQKRQVTAKITGSSNVVLMGASTVIDRTLRSH